MKNEKNYWYFLNFYRVLGIGVYYFFRFLGKFKRGLFVVNFIL